MKTLTYFFCFVVLTTANQTMADIPVDYPFKTFVDKFGNLYTAGDTSINGSINVLIKKFNSIGQFQWRTIVSNPQGLDRATDLIVHGTFPYDVYLTGTRFESSVSIHKYFVMCLRNVDGHIEWNSINELNSQSFSNGIDLDSDQNVYISGCIEGRNGKDFLTAKYDLDGNLQWFRTYNNPKGNGNDIATDILVDMSYVYVLGSTYSGYPSGNDIMLVTYSKSGTFHSGSIHLMKGNEFPTAFTFIERSDDPRAKSRCSVSGFSDNATFHGTRDILTIGYDDDSLSSVMWSDSYNNPVSNDNDIPTAMTWYRKGNTSYVYVAGYSRNGQKQIDFTTLKYEMLKGSRQWVRHYDYPSSISGDDRASSIIVHDDSLVISGSCSRSPNGFATIKYPLNGNDPPAEEAWVNTFIPSFLVGRNPDEYKSASILHRDSSGNITVFFMAWNETFRSFAAQMYDPAGNVIYTLDPDVDNSISFQGYSLLQETDAKDDSGARNRFLLKQNHPNPFNPVTKINFNISNEANVQVKVYDVSGKEIAVLINEKLSSGDHEVNFNGSNFPSGVYFYRMYVNGNIVETMRMMMLK